MWFHFDEGNVVEHHLILLNCSLVEDFRWYVLRRDINSLGSAFFQRVGKQAHFKFKAKHIDLGDVLLAAFQNDLFDKQPSHRQIDWPDRHQSPCFLVVEGFKTIRLFGSIGF